MSAGCEAPSCNVSPSLWVDLHTEIETQVRTGGQFATEEAIKKETSIRFMDLYVNDVKSIVKETSGVQIVEGDDFLITDQGLMIRVQGSLVPAEYEFITKRQEKGLEDPKESQTLRGAMSAMLSSPDVEVFFPVHNKGSDGTYQIRFVAHWKREGNLIKTEMINITDGGPAKSLEEASQTIGERFAKTVPQLQEVHETVAIVSDAGEQTIQPTIEENIDLHQPDPNENKSKVDHEQKHEEQVDSVIRVETRIAPSVKETAVTLGSYALYEVSKPVEKKDEPTKGSSVVERVRKLFRKSEALEMRQMQEKKPERLTIEKIRQKPVEQRAEIQKQHKEMRRVERALAFVAETKVAVGAVPVLLAALAKESPKPIKAIEKSIRRHKKKELRMKKQELRIRQKQKEKRFVRRKIEYGRTAQDRTATKKQRARRREKRSLDQGIKRVAAAEKLTPLFFEKRRRQRRRRGALQRPVLHNEKSIRLQTEEKKKRKMLSKEKRRRYRETKLVVGAEKKMMKTREQRVEKRAKRIFEHKKIKGTEKRLWISFARLAIRLAPSEQKTPVRRKKESKKLRFNVLKHNNTRSKEGPEEHRKEKTVVKLLFAYVVLLLLKSEPVLLSVPKENKRLPRSEPIPWILASIIYHLTMLREGGAKNNVKFQMSNVKSKKKIRRRGKPVLFHFPARAVIFAYGS